MLLQLFIHEPGDALIFEVESASSNSCLMSILRAKGDDLNLMNFGFKQKQGLKIVSNLIMNIVALSYRRIFQALEVLSTIISHLAALQAKDERQDQNLRNLPIAKHILSGCHRGSFWHFIGVIDE